MSYERNPRTSTWGMTAVLFALVVASLLLGSRDAASTECGKFGQMLAEITQNAPRRGRFASRASIALDRARKAKKLGGMHRIPNVDKVMQELVAKADEIEAGRGPLFELVDGARYDNLTEFRRAFLVAGDELNVDLVLRADGSPDGPITHLIENFASAAPDNDIASIPEEILDLQGKLADDVRKLARLVNKGVTPAGEIHIYGKLTPNRIDALERLANALLSQQKQGSIKILDNLKSVVGDLD